jgi:hypothetical protein
MVSAESMFVVLVDFVGEVCPPSLCPLLAVFFVLYEEAVEPNLFSIGPI